MRTIKKFWKTEFWMLPVQKIYATVPERIRKQPLIDIILKYVLDDRFFTDVMYRTEVLLYPGFAANLLYSAMQLVLGIFYRSVWSGALAVYYALLAVMRVQLLKPMKQSNEKDSVVSELQRYRLCGIILLCMTPIFASIMILVVHKNSGAEYPGFTIVIMAVYAVCIVVCSISNLAKFKKYKRPAMSAAKIICLIAALMSVLSLVTAIVVRFGDASGEPLGQGLIGTAGGAVCVVVLAMSIYMVTHSSKELKSFLNNKIDDEVSNSFNKQ